MAIEADERAITHTSSRMKDGWKKDGYGSGRAT